MATDRCDVASLDPKLDLLDAVAEWFVSAGEAHLSSGDLESCLRSAHVAASVWMLQNRQLVAPRLEALLRWVAERIDDDHAAPTGDVGDLQGQTVCLHVLEEALAAGGLTAMATRWIENDRAARVHCVALLSQNAPVPTTLAQAVHASGGRIWRPPEGASFDTRARWLRSLCSQLANVVVLHAGVSDTVFGAALGRPGGAPVLLVNHAAHIFWVGSTVVDLVLNCRGSALEQDWTRRYRGARCMTVPIPLSDHAPPEATDAHTPSDAIRAAKSQWGVSPDAPVILTVGATFKYQRTRDLDFVSALEAVVQQVPGAVLLAAGVVPDERWTAAGERTGGRIRALGPVDHAAVSQLHAMADVYVEGFPFGTTTALLEAGLRGIPAVLAPAEAPPPYGTDGIAIDSVLSRPASVADHQRMLLSLLEDAPARRRLGRSLAESIRAHHTGVGWQRHLQDAIDALPEAHTLPSAAPVSQVDRPVYERWADFIEQTSSPYAEVLEHAIVRARLLGLTPRLTDEVADAARRAASLRSGVGIPLPLLRVMVNSVLPLLPHRLGTHLFRTVGLLCRHDAARRLRQRLLGSKQERRSWYSGYRDLSR